MTIRYDRGNVIVDDDFARFGSKTYAIDKINSVEVRTKVASKKGAWIAAIFAFIFALSLFHALSSDDAKGVTGTALIVLILGGYAVFRFTNPKPDHHSLFLMTSSSEAQAFETIDGDDISNLRNAIEQAMVAKSN